MTDKVCDMKTWRLLNILIWGDEPKNLNEVTDELKRRGIDHESITSEINTIIERYSTE